MKRLLLLAIASCFFGGCAAVDQELPSGDEQQLDHPATLSGNPPADPLERPDDSALQPVPGER